MPALARSGRRGHLLDVRRVLLGAEAESTAEQHLQLKSIPQLMMQRMHLPRLASHVDRRFAALLLLG